MRAVIWVALFGCFAVLAASYGGALHPLGDSLAVFRLHIGLACIGASSIGLRLHRLVGIGGLLASGTALIPVLVTTFIAFDYAPRPASLYQKNMLFQARDLSPLIDDIREAQPDALTLQEVTPVNAAMLTALANALPSQLICPFARVGAVAVASRWPLIEGQEICLEGQGLAAIQVTSPNGPLWIVSIHLHWPWPKPQAAQRTRLPPILKDLQGPVLIGGDFNMVPWSHSLRSITRATDTQRIGRAFNSMTRFALAPLPIDHILVPEGATGSTELRPLLGSDHHGILARFDFPRP